MIIMMMPVTKSVAQWMGGLQRKLMTSKDNRVEVNRYALPRSSSREFDRVCVCVCVCARVRFSLLDFLGGRLVL